MRDYGDLIKDLREYAELVDHDMWDCPYIIVDSIMIADSMKQAADAIEKLVDDRKALKRLVERRKSVGKVPFDPKNSESRNAMIELHRIDSLIVDGVVFTFNNDKTSHMPLPEPPKEEKE